MENSLKDTSRENLENKENSNPLYNSPVSERIDLGEKPVQELKYRRGMNIGVYKENETGEEYIEKRKGHSFEEFNPKIEHFVSMITKGVLHSSDVILKDGKYFSRKINLEETEKPRDGEIEAELFLLKYVFEDWDKILSDKKSQRNLQIDENGKFAHYDYGVAFNHDKQLKDTLIGSESKKVSKSIKKELVNNSSEMKAVIAIKKIFIQLGLPVKIISGDTEKEILNKAYQLEEQLDDNQFFNAVIEKSGINLEEKEHFGFLKEEEPEKRKIEFQKKLLNRISTIINTIQK